MKTGEKIKAARKTAKLTQAELARKLSVTPGMIGQYETGKRKPKFETIEKIAAALHVDPYQLIEDDPEWVAFPKSAVISGKTGEMIYDVAEIIEPYSKLNPAGKRIAVERVQELTEIPKYQKEPESNPNPEE